MNLVSERIINRFDTIHLHIRQAHPDDAQQLFEAATESIADIYPFLAWCHPEYKLSEAQAWLAQVQQTWHAGTNFALLMFNRDTDKLVGGCGLNRFDEHPVANLGYWVRSSCSGQGFATEAAKGLTRFGMVELELKRIEIIMSTANEASRKVAEKCGGKFEGLLANRLLLHGEMHDARMYSITATPTQVGYHNPTPNRHTTGKSL